MIIDELKLQTRKRWQAIDSGSSSDATKSVKSSDKLIDSLEDEETLKSVLESLMNSSDPAEVMTGCAYAFAKNVLREMAWEQVKKAVLSEERNPVYANAHLMVMMYATEEEKEGLRELGYEI